MSKNNAGFSLIEVLLYLAISSVLLFAVSGFVVLSFQSRAESQVIGEVEQQGQHIMQVITASVRSASSISAPTAGNGGTALTLVTTSSATNPTTISLAGTTLSMAQAANPAVVLHNSQISVSDLSFTNASRPATAGNVRIQFKVSYNSVSDRREYKYSKVFYGSATLR